MRPIAIVLACAGVLGCNGTTGSGLVTFSARAGGAADIAPGISFTSPRGYDVTLTTATFHLGAVYLNMSRPSSGGPEEPCILPGIYVAQAFPACSASPCGVDLDLLSPSLTSFTSAGQGTLNKAVEGEVWLSGGDINAPDDPTPILHVVGSAEKGGTTWPFDATITIGQNRALAPPNVAMPGANPICRRRIASLIPVDFTVTDGGTLSLRIDARGLFQEVDFAALGPGSTTTIVIPDVGSGVSDELYQGLLFNSGVYDFAFASAGR
jgi:hypothetical protein